MNLSSGRDIVPIGLPPVPFLLSVEGDPTSLPDLVNLQPQEATTSEIVTAYWVNLGRMQVAQLILVGARRTTIANIVGQRPDSIKFRVPPMLAPGDYRIVLVAHRRWGMEMLVQDVLLKVITADESTQSLSVSGISQKIKLLNLVA